MDSALPHICGAEIAECCMREIHFVTQAVLRRLMFKKLKPITKSFVSYPISRKEEEGDISSKICVTALRLKFRSLLVTSPVVDEPKKLKYCR